MPPQKKRETKLKDLKSQPSQQPLLQPPLKPIVTNDNVLLLKNSETHHSHNSSNSNININNGDNVKRNGNPVKMNEKKKMQANPENQCEKKKKNPSLDT